MESARTRPGARLWSPHFLITLVMLGSAAVIAGPLANHLRLQRLKDPIELRQPLTQLDEAKLGPYEVTLKQLLDHTVVEALGTEDFISWNLEDRSVREDDPLRFANLFVTYYTGGHRLVPHTPDVCYVGGGHEPAQPHENAVLTIDSLGPESVEVPIRVLTFRRTAVFDEARMSVVYTFNCNGGFTSRPQQVRMWVNAPTTKYAYFSKVEVSFPGATREETVEGARKLLSYALPALIDDHWPDFEAAEAAAAATEEAATDGAP
jgi:hypothetical protein